MSTDDPSDLPEFNVKACQSIRWQEPDVAELDRVAVVLKVNRSWLTWITTQTGSGVIHRDLDIVLNQDAIVMDSHPGRSNFLAILEPGGLELDIVALPDRRGLADVDSGCRDFVDRSAVVWPWLLDAIAVENLDLVASLKVDAAISPGLAHLLWLIGGTEFDVKLEAPVVFAHRAQATPLNLGGTAFDKFPGRLGAVRLNPAVQTLAVEENDGSFGGWGRLDVLFVFGPGNLQTVKITELGM